MSLAGFTSVNTAGAVWEPKQTGSKKQNNLTPLVADDNSYMTGYYIGAKVIEVKGSTSTLHEFKFQSVGDEKTIIGEMVNGVVGIWGTGVLNNTLAEKVQPGQLVAVVWKGKQQPKQAGGNPYHNWDVMINDQEEPIPVGATQVINDPQPASNPAEAIVDDADEDDLPF